MAAIAADRHLLLGLLALQNGLIHQSQLVAAFQAWTLAKSRSLADHLEALGHLSPAQRSVVEAMAALHLEAHGGDVEKSLAAVPAGKSTLESLAAVHDPEIERTLSQVGSACPPADDGDRTASYAVGTATSDGQRFRVLRPHARGGLGAVFVALDTALHREVALKQILDRHAADPASRQRFLVEAEITGGLEHPGIVPVYGLGTYGDGRPYYAMRFVRGDSLKEAIAAFHADGGPKADSGRRSLELRKLLRRFMDVCNAIDYAHSRGVLHRDIKPGNIIVGKHGETLVVDWGLAKARGRSDGGVSPDERPLVPSSASGSAETLPGSALGTPAYMSPEQASGDLDHLGPPSDVYSLGATLYCLLTGRPPVEDDDVGAVLRAVQQGRFPPPRQVDPAIDRALEAICLKAMSPRPEDRYAMPKALADDLERWMADEPVVAWREPVARRARRWARRNRTKVATAVAAMLAGVIGLSAILVVQTQAKAEVAKALARETNAKDALAAANRELIRSKAAVQARYDLAVEAIRTFHTGVSEDFLLTEEKFKALRDRLLKSAADFYGKLGALLGRETDIASRRALAASNFELANLTAKVGRSADALAAHRAALAAREALAAEPGANAAVQTEWGRSLTAVGALLHSTGKTDESAAAYRRSESVLAGPAESDASARAARADCRSELGRLLADTGRLAEALAAYMMARADQEALAAAPGASDDARRNLALTVSRTGIVLHQMGTPAEAEAELRRALALYRELAEGRSASPGSRRDLANAHGNLGILLDKADKLAEAEAEHRRALAIRQELIQNYPGVSEFRSRLADSHFDLGWLLDRAGKLAEAEPEYRRALAIRRELIQDNPAVTGFTRRLAGIHHQLAWLLWRTSRPAEAEAEYRQGLAIYGKLAQDHPTVTDFRSRLALIENDFAWVLSQMGRTAEAAAGNRRALSIYRELAEEHPAISDFRRGLTDSHARLGRLLSETGEPGAAAVEFRAALAIDHKLAAEHPSVPADRDQAANLENNLSVALRRLGRPAEAGDPAERAVGIREALIREAPAAPGYRAGLAENLVNRGLARRATGDPAGAAVDLRRALGLYDAVRSRTSEGWFVSACARAALAGLAGAPGSGVSAAEAVSESDTAMALLRQAVALDFRNPDIYRTEDALNPLRGRDDFRLLMMDLAMPADAFASDQH